MYKHNIVKLAMVSPLCKVGEVKYNVNEIIKCINEAANHGASIIALPEMCITGYNVLDLLNQDYLYEDNLNGIKALIDLKYEGLLVINSYIRLNSNMFIASILINDGNIIGIVPKTVLNRNSNSFEDKYFIEGENSLKEIDFLGFKVPFGKMLFKSSDDELCLALEVGEELTSLTGVSSLHYRNGANVIINSSYLPSIVDMEDRIESVLKTKTIISNASYFLVSTNCCETSSEELPSGLVIGYINGKCVVKNNDVTKVESKIEYCDIDLGSINYQRRESGFRSIDSIPHIEVSLKESKDYSFEGAIDKSPFLTLSENNYSLIIDAQCRSLINRLNYIGTKKTVIGVSGGLDSTLALLSVAHAYDLMGWDKKDIYALTLPSSNTSDRTYNSANTLMDLLGVTKREINIHDDVERELIALNHPLDVKDTTYENIQARFRTYTLMNTANNVGGIVVGTSDMSEVALGWSTFNGDQMAMYGVNAALPKTLIREVTRRYKDIYPSCASVIDDVINTPISPELTGAQLTEDIIGKYEINDFILYNMMRNGHTYEKLEFMIQKAFGVSDDVAKTYVKNFNKRFYHQQFKRLTMPEAIRILWFGLSSRTGLKVIGDVSER